MGYRVKGTLKLPDGTPGTNCEIEFASRKNFTPVLTGMGVSIRTDSAGAYDVTLEYGAYAVILRTGNTYPTAIGQIIVASDTVVGQDLPTLLEQSGWQPATPEYIQQINKWLAEANASATMAEASAVKSAADGAAQAALAKSQADRAKAEADRASQISGLGTVSDAIGLAALPLPDVWAPLSDSLRLITGYGRDVLVGSDVVARMVNFSRNSAASSFNKSNQLESYSANAPRFAPKGLLGEPGSSNYITTSEGLSQIGAEAGSSVVTESGVTLVSYTGTGGLSKDYSAPASTALTLSFYVRIGGGVGSTINVQMRDGPSVGFTASISVSAAGVLSISNSDNILTSWGVEAVSPSLVRAFAVIKPSTATLYRLYRGSPAVGETFGSFQLETWPFATSYIKTSGAVTTRASDAASIPSSGNRFYKPFFSVAFSWSLLGIRTDIADNRLVDFDNDASANRHYVGISQDGKLAAQFGTNRVVSSSPISGGVSVLVVNGTTFSLYHGGVKIGEAPVTGWSGSPNGKINLLCNNTGLLQSAGSIRDLKMWMFALTDAQAKAVR